MNDNKQIAVYDNTVSARTYLSYIAEQAGGFACIGRDGKLYIKRIGENIINFNVERFQNFTWGEKFVVSRIAYEDGIQDFKCGNTDNNTIWINQENMYIVDIEQIENIYNEYSDFECYSFDGTTIIDPSYDIGDILIIDGKKVIYQGDMNYVGKFKADIKSSIQPKAKEENMKTISAITKIRRVQSLINQLNGEIEQLVEETDENSEKISDILQTVSEITAKVSDISDLTKKVSGLKTVTIDDAILGSLIRLNIRGNNTVFSGLYFDEGTWYFDDEHYFTKSDATIMINDEVFELGINGVLRQLGDVYDEYVYDFINEYARVIRRVGVDENDELYELENEVITELEMPDLKLNDGENTITILNYSANFTAEYVVKNDYTSMLATNAKLEASLDITAREITEKVTEDITEAKDELTQNFEGKLSTTSREVLSQVSEGYTTKDETSGIEQRVTTAEGTLSVQARQILAKLDSSDFTHAAIIALINNGDGTSTAKINATYLDLTGLVTIAKLKGSGTTEINGANIKTGMINSSRLDTSTINASNGTIGGFNINNNSLQSNSAGFTSNELVAFWAGTSPTDTYGGHHPFEATWNGAVYALAGIYGWRSNHHVPYIRTLTDDYDGTGVEIQYIYRNQDTYTFTFEVRNSGTWSIQMSPPSDKKLKENIKRTAIRALDTINSIEFKQFDWIQDKCKEIGFNKADDELHEEFGVIADELEKVNPNFVFENKDKNGKPIKTVNRQELIYYNSKAIQELSEELDEVKKENAELKSVINDLITRIEKLENKEETHEVN